MKNERKKFCPSCGNELSENAKFCGKCGYQFDTTLSSSPQTIEPIPIKKNKKKHTLLKVVGILVVAFILFAIFSEEDTSYDNTNVSHNISEDTDYEDYDNYDDYDTDDLSDLNSILGLYTQLSNNESTPYTLNSKAQQFLTEYDYLFPALKSSTIPNEIVDPTIDYRQILKNSEKFGDKLISLSYVQVVQIFEEEIAEDTYFTTLNIIDENGQQYYIFYNGELDNIYEDSMINVIGLPLGNSSFENTAGGETLVIVLAGSYVELVE